MTIEEAIKKITDNYDKLLKKQIKNYGWPKTNAIWIHNTDDSESYETDQEWIGVCKNGELVWAYASGCSCWDGEFDEEICDLKTIKETKFNHKDMQEEWEEEIINFASKL